MKYRCCDCGLLQDNCNTCKECGSQCFENDDEGEEE